MSKHFRYTLLVEEQENSPQNFKEFENRLKLSKVMDNIICGKSEQNFDECPFYSIGQNNRDYRLGLACVPKPGKTALVIKGLCLMLTDVPFSKINY